MNTAWNSPTACTGSLWWGWEEKGEKGMVKYKHSIFIWLENTHELGFSLDLYVVTVVHMTRGDLCSSWHCAKCHAFTKQEVPICSVVLPSVGSSRMWTGQLRGRMGPCDGSQAMCAAAFAKGQVGTAGEQGLRRVPQWYFAGADGKLLLRAGGTVHNGIWVAENRNDLCSSNILGRWSWARLLGQQKCCINQGVSVEAAFRNADLGPRNLLHVHDAASNGINKSKCTLYAVLPVGGGPYPPSGNSAGEREGSWAAKPRVASQSPSGWYTWDQCSCLW